MTFAVRMRWEPDGKWQRTKLIELVRYMEAAGPVLEQEAILRKSLMM